MISEKRNLIKNDFPKIVKGAVIAGAGSALFYVLEALPGVDFGDWTPIVIPILAVFSNAIRIWWNENHYSE